MQPTGPGILQPSPRPGTEDRPSRSGTLRSVTGTIPLTSGLVSGPTGVIAGGPGSGVRISAGPAVERGVFGRPVPVLLARTTAPISSGATTDSSG